MSTKTSTASGFALERFHPGSEYSYAQFLASIEDSLLYYSVPYRDFLLDLLGCEEEYWLAWEGERITGVLPVMYVDGPWGRVVNSLPFFGSNGGVLGLTPSAEAALTEKYNEIATRPGVVSATWTCHPFRTPRSVAHDLTDERIGQFTILSGERCAEERLRAAIEGSARRNIKHAVAAGVEVAVENDCIEFLKRTHMQNMEEIGGSPKSERFFELLPKHFVARKDYDIYAARRAGQLVAALLIFYFNTTVEYFVPVTSAGERESQPMSLILWTAMVEATRRGFKRWNWGGTWTSQEGVWRFKHKWAAEDHRYRYYIRADIGRLTGRSSAEILAAYPGFYVIPFARLSMKG